MTDNCARLAALEAEAAIRRVAARYMALCDQPPTAAPGIAFDDLFTDDLIWEGVGRRASAEFTRVEGRAALLAWFDTMRQPPKYLFNVHYLTSESILVDGAEATGTWMMAQAAVRISGEGELRMARLSIRFRRDEDKWRIGHFQTESLFRLDLASDQVAGLVQGVAT